MSSKAQDSLNLQNPFFKVAIGATSMQTFMTRLHPQAEKKQLSEGSLDRSLSAYMGS